MENNTNEQVLTEEQINNAEDLTKEEKKTKFGAWCENVADALNANPGEGGNEGVYKIIGIALGGVIILTVVGGKWVVKKFKLDKKIAGFAEKVWGGIKKPFTKKAPKAPNEVTSTEEQISEETKSEVQDEPKVEIVEEPPKTRRSTRTNNNK